MALSIGTQAPDFTLPSSGDRDFSLSRDMAGKPCVIFFYPKDFTPTCTKEACSFRDTFAEFKGLSVDVVGISRDSVALHKKFIAEYNLPFELLADEDGEVCKLYDALVPIIKIPKRITYLLDSTHKIVAVVDNMFSADEHIEDIIKELQGV